MSESLRSLFLRISQLKWPIRGYKSTFLTYLAAVTVSSILSYFIAFALRFDFEVPSTWQEVRNQSLIWLVPLQLVCLFASGSLRPLVARLRWPDLIRVAGGIVVFTCILLFLWYHFQGEKTPPRAVIILQGCLMMPVVAFLQGATPYLYNFYRGEFGKRASAGRVRGRIIVIGTGYVAYWLVRQMQEEAGARRRVVGVVSVSCEPRYKGRFLCEAPVIGQLDELEFLVRKYDADRIIIGVPTLEADKIQQVVDTGRKLRVPVRIVPSPQEMLFGQVQAAQVRAVSLEDVLGRSVLDSDTPSIHKLISGKRILVTGAAGSIGSELCRQILSYGPEELYVLDNSEPSLYTLQQKLAASPIGANTVRPLLYSVRDANQLKQLLEKIRPALVFHSAALKHVPMMEMFPAEGLLTNTLGTINLARIAAEVSAEKFVFVSTDKAIRPTNAMGASKRMAEVLLLQVQQEIAKAGKSMEIISVRFGNVLRSSGSVVPLFEKQIRAGGPVTVTDPNVIRYFMSIPEAVGLVLQSATMGKSGDIFVLDMGEPMRIVDMAHRLITLYGLEPEHDIPIHIIGLRPGEKLFEELSYDSEVHLDTSHPRIWRLRPAAADGREAPGSISGEELHKALLKLLEEDRSSSPAVVKEKLAKLLPDYHPDWR